MDAVYLRRKPKSNSTGEFHIDLLGCPIKLNRLVIGHIKLILMLFKMNFCNVFNLILYLSSIYWTKLFILLQFMLKSYKCIYFLLNVNSIVFIH